MKRNDWLLADTANHCALFESEIVLKFYNLEARIHRTYIIICTQLMEYVFLGDIKPGLSPFNIKQPLYL